jgi:hypothetical protein
MPWKRIVMLSFMVFPTIACAQESSTDRPTHHHHRLSLHHGGTHHRLYAHHYRSRGTARFGTWGATAVGEDDGGMSSGYARGATPQDAINAAVARCAATGRANCYAPNAAFSGCGYVAINEDGYQNSWGTGGTPQQATEWCQGANGAVCKPPIGGCN